MIQGTSNDLNTLPAPKRRGRKNFDVKPFPTGAKLVGIFTGLDVEVFENIDTLINCGCYGNNSLNYRQRYTADEKIPIVTQTAYKRKQEWKEKYQATNDESSRKILVDEDVLADPFPLTQSYVLILEEAMFLHKELVCLEIKDLDGHLMSTEELWQGFCDIKHNFVACYVSYLYLKSKNWVIKSGIKFGGHFRELQCLRIMNSLN